MNELLRTASRTWLYPVLAVVALNFAYFAPVVFQGKQIPQDDIKLGLAKGKEIVDYRAATGEEPLWTNAMFSGMPTFQMSTLYPNNVLSYVDAALRKPLVEHSGVYLIGLLMLGFFALLRAEKVQPWLSVAGALAFGFSGFFIISLAAGHNAKIHTAAYMAPVVLGILMVYRGQLAAGFAVTALATGLNIHANHFQITYYTAIPALAIAVAFLVELARSGQIKQWVLRSALLLGAAVVGIGPNFGNLWSTYAYTKATMRGGHSDLTPIADTAATATPAEKPAGLDFDYAMSWSYGVTESLNMFIPNLMGGGAKQDYEGTQTYDNLARVFQQQGLGGERLKETVNQYAGSFLYWGDQSMVNGAYYLGSVVFFLFVLGALTVRGATRNWVLGAVAISLILAWGRNFESINRILFDNLPLYNKFRVPSMALVVSFLAVPYLAFVGLQQWLSGSLGGDEQKRKLMLATAITGGIALLVGLIGPGLFSLEGLNDANLAQQGFDLGMLEEDRASLMRSSAWRSLFFVLATAALLWLQLTGKIKPTVFAALLVAAVAADQWGFDRDQLGSDEFQTEREFKSAFTPTPADEFILKDTDLHYRVYNTTSGLTSDSYTSYFHKSVGGYHGAKLARYQDLIERQLSQGNIAAFSMLNTKWVILQDPQSGVLQAQPNMSACGNAWFPKELRQVANADEAMAALSSFDPMQTAIVEQGTDAERLLNSQTPDSTAKITLTKYDPKVMTYAVEGLTTSSAAVFSEIFYEVPGQRWVATADGKEIPVARVNYVLRAAVIPAGTKEVVFHFEPETYTTGSAVDGAFSLVLLASVGLALWIEFKRRRSA
ncbi:MAG: hypothetical protein RL608_1325 [Bacteroidota bacterium]|jgi:hypothetical protein